MGVEKLAEEPNITAMMNGIGLTPRACPIMMARGVSNTATALLETISVKIAASR